MRAWVVLFLLLSGVAAADKVRIFYVEPELEMKLSAVLQRGSLPLPLYRVGVSKSQNKLFAMVHFGCQGAAREDVHREALLLARRAFAGMPGLAQLDIVGVDRAQTPTVKPETLFSATIRKHRLEGVSPAWPPARQLQSMGETYSSPALSWGEPSEQRLRTAALDAWRRSRPPGLAGKRVSAKNRRNSLGK